MSRISTREWLGLYELTTTCMADFITRAAVATWFEYSRTDRPSLTANLAIGLLAHDDVCLDGLPSPDFQVGDVPDSFRQAREKENGKVVHADEYSKPGELASDTRANLVRRVFWHCSIMET